MKKPKDMEPGEFVCVSLLMVLVPVASMHHFGFLDGSALALVVLYVLFRQG